MAQVLMTTMSAAAASATNDDIVIRLTADNRLRVKCLFIDNCNTSEEIW